MSALQSIDESLFRFVNLKLANPFFDVLMPFLSNNKFFFPTVVIIGVLTFWRGGCNGRIYVLMIAILLSLGDPCVCNPVKHLIKRPRPFMAVLEARRPDKDLNDKDVLEDLPADTPAPIPKPNSMPSAHAFNWGAFAMITFIYYRRSWRFMVPLALAVSFSRIYNGVHYPTDVIAGLLFGATYAVLGIFAISVLWELLGRRFFPKWQSRLPNLLVPSLEPAEAKADRAKQGIGKSPQMTK